MLRQARNQDGPKEKGRKTKKDVASDHSSDRMQVVSLLARNENMIIKGDLETYLKKTIK